MNTIFTGQIFLIDEDFERALVFKKKLKDINNSIFFNYYSSVKEAFKIVLNDNVIAPEFVYVHASLANFEAKEILKKLRLINKTKNAKIIVFGNAITDAIVAASVKDDFMIIKTYPDNEEAECVLFDTEFVGPNCVMLCSSHCKCC
jgi:molybdopterin/thiamine biosynthesis adenylyltransferase